MAWAAAGVALAAACARQGAPPGGPEDRRPPVVVTTRPDTYDVVDRDLETAVFVFDERVSERVAGGTMDDAVLVSPRTGEVSVDHDGDRLEVFLAGGYQAGRVYRVTLLPVLSDLFGNQMRDPFELVFSTGGELVPSAVAGLAWDRVTGQGVEGLEVVARDTRDSTLYVARTDTAGIYALRYLPPGPYYVTAFQDRDRDGEVDPMEPQGGQLLQVSGPDTVVASFGVLQPDTTPAVLTSAELLDSQTVVIRFDEPLDPRSTPTSGNVGLTAVAVDDSMEVRRGPEGEVILDESIPAPQVRAVFHPAGYRAWLLGVRDSLARLDSLDRAGARDARQLGETARADSLEARTPRPLPPELPRLQGRAARSPGGGGEAPEGPPPVPTGPDGQPLPDPRMVVRVDRPLELERPYQVAATGVVNVARVPLGAGTALVVRVPPPPPDTATDSLAVDSLALDSLGGDSAGAVPDSSAVRPDTVGTGSASDTLPPPDTLARAGAEAPAGEGGAGGAADAAPSVWTGAGRGWLDPPRRPDPPGAPTRGTPAAPVVP